ncbi:MAG TPA: HEAT repeat domain-containing protein [Candidatus Hydrogenedentes bacterium]|nr:HEAT repeat domain-containing protein [Candidatus Hydrogenedentota bacterium]
MKKHHVLMMLTAALLIPALAVAQTTVADLLSKLPAQNAADFDAMMADLVKAGPPAILELSAKMLPPGAGDTTQVEFALNGLAKYVMRPGAENERKMMAEALLQALQTASDKEVKAFLIRQLQIAGREEAVMPLGALLTDEALYEPAAQALLAIRTPEVPAVFAAALKTAQGKNQIAIIKALGELRCIAAVQDILPLAKSSDAAIRDAAALALADIAAPEAAPLLVEAMQTSPGYDRLRAASNYLLYARRRAEAGDKAVCETICRELLKAAEVHIASAALRQLVTLLGEEGFPEVLAAMDSPDSELRGAALRLASAFPGEAATRQWMEKAAKADPIVRVEIMNMLALRGDFLAYTLFINALASADKPVRLAAVQALPRFNAAETVPSLIKALNAAAEEDERAAAKAALVCCHDEQLTTLAANALSTAAPPARIALLEILSARRADTFADVVFSWASDSDPAVRLAALNALGNVESPDHLPRLAEIVRTVQNEEDLTAARQAVVAVTKQNADIENRVDPLFVTLAQTADERKAAFYQVLSELGGGKALQCVVAATANGAANVRDAAIHALAAWKEPGAAPELLNVVRNAPEPEYQSLAMDGYVRLMKTIPAAEQTGWAKNALDAARRPEEKKAVIGAVADVHALEALHLIAAYLDDEALKEDAALAAAKIACPQKEEEAGLIGGDVKSILQKALMLVHDESWRKKIEAQIAK